MPDTAVPRTTQGYLTSSNPTLRAQGQYRQSGQIPDGYTRLENGMLHSTEDMQSFLNKYGWMLMAGLPTAGLFTGLALGPGAAAASATGGAVPSVGATGGLPAGALPTVAGTAGAKGAAMGLPFGLGAKDLMQAVPLLASLFHRGGSSAPPQEDAMNELIGMQTQRLKQSDPLYQAVLQMAMRLMPTAYQPQAPQAPAASLHAPQTMPRRMR